jgi:hypothetical protein
MNPLSGAMFTSHAGDISSERAQAFSVCGTASVVLASATTCGVRTVSGLEAVAVGMASERGEVTGDE